MDHGSLVVFVSVDRHRDDLHTGVAEFDFSSSFDPVHLRHVDVHYDDFGREALRQLNGFLANGDAIERKMGNAGFEYLGEVAHARVIFGEEGDAALMGVTTLEAFGFVLDPFKRELRPMPMRL